jgi:hypothetical protein
MEEAFQPGPGGPSAGFTPFADEAGATPPGQATPAQAQAAAEWQSIRDAAKRFGYEGLAQFNDDEAALAHLVQQARRAQQADVYAQLGRAVAPELQQYQEFRETKQKATGPAPEAAYRPPDFQENWLALCERDPATGMFFAKPGVNPAVADALNKRAAWQRDFDRDPTTVMDKYAEGKLGPMVEQRVQQALSHYRRDIAVEQILQANDAWLYQRDASGRPVTGPQGRVPTAEGAAYIQHVRLLQERGVTDPVAQDDLARKLVIGQLALGRLSQQGAQAPAAQTQHAAARPNVNPNQARPPHERARTPGAVEPNSEGLSLTEMLRGALEEAGIDDAQLQQQLNF